ncbi:MAG: cobyric acid synthase CobQ, partial [Nitrospinae bacterium]|nr:cobyric acid synthase CobQ [Nitrospinota bacterium]
MLGERLEDPEGVESPQPQAPGLGFLPVTTRFQQDKALYQVEAVHAGTGLPVGGYEIHMGESLRVGPSRPVVHIRTRNGQVVDLADGAIIPSGRVWGCYVHGLFDNEAFRRHFLAEVRAAFGLPMPEGGGQAVESPYDRLADAFERHIDMTLLSKILNARGLNRNPSPSGRGSG